jgi:hypothetical protein
LRCGGSSWNSPIRRRWERPRSSPVRHQWLMDSYSQFLIGSSSPRRAAGGLRCFF